MTDTLRETLDNSIEIIIKVEIETIHCFDRIILADSVDINEAITCYEEILKIHKLLQNFQELREHAYNV